MVRPDLGRVAPSDPLRKPSGGDAPELARRMDFAEWLDHALSDPHKTELLLAANLSARHWDFPLEPGYDLIPKT